MSKILWLKVPYGKKDLAKKLGAKWSATKALWYIDAILPLGPAKSWVIELNEG